MPSAPTFCVCLALLMLVACAVAVPLEDVSGTYVAHYPFGKETLILNRDKTFLQRVAIGNERAVIVRGLWDFDARISYLKLDGSLDVADGFGRLRRDWMVVRPGYTSLPVEISWCKVIINSGAEYPYAKQ